MQSVLVSEINAVMIWKIKTHFQHIIELYQHITLLYYHYVHVPLMFNQNLNDCIGEISPISHV